MKSLPVRGAWIEMACVAVCFSQAVSLPVRGAWIEMDFVIVMVSQVKWSLPVRGAWIEIIVNAPSGISLVVAPRAGSVD